MPAAIVAAPAIRHAPRCSFSSVVPMMAANS